MFSFFFCVCVAFVCLVLCFVWCCCVPRPAEDVLCFKEFRLLRRRVMDVDDGDDVIGARVVTRQQRCCFDWQALFYYLISSCCYSAATVSIVRCCYGISINCVHVAVPTHRQTQAPLFESEAHRWGSTTITSVNIIFAINYFILYGCWMRALYIYRAIYTPGRCIICVVCSVCATACHFWWGYANL